MGQMGRSRVQDLVRDAASRLEAAGISHARHEVEWLLEGLTGRPRLELYLEPGAVSPHVAVQLHAQIQQRAAGIPLQYLLGEAEFYGRTFEVSAGVFIPRPETECVIDAALRRLRVMAGALGRPLRLLDLGTGSGCLAVTLATELPACHVVAVEVSWDGCQVARRNIARHGLLERVGVVQGRWADAIRGWSDALVSNPPYIPSLTVDELPPDVRHEPRESLDGGPDGLRELTRLLAEAPRIVRPGGLVAFECGEEQVGPLTRALASCSWAHDVAVVHDLARRPRGILVQRTGSERGQETV